jgi:hypothetical protein
MADLLECLIQIKALGETLERISRLAGGTSARAPLERLAEAERRYARALGVEAGTAVETIAARDAASDAPPEEFVALRHANLAALGRCTAIQLGSPVEWPGRRSTTVADLVAIMLASDTEMLGELCRRQVGR